MKTFSDWWDANMPGNLPDSAETRNLRRWCELAWANGEYTAIHTNITTHVTDQLSLDEVLVLYRQLGQFSKRIDPLLLSSHA